MSTNVNISLGLGEFKLLERFVVAMEQQIATKQEEITPPTPTNTRFSYTVDGAYLIIHDDITGINRATCYNIEDAVAICAALHKVETAKQSQEHE